VWRVPAIARNFLTRPPTGTPRRAISPGEGFLFPSLHHQAFSPKGVAGLSFTARIGRAPFHRARSASKKDGLAAPFSSSSGRALREHRRSSGSIPPSRLLCSHRPTPPNDLSPSIATSRAHEAICFHLFDHPSRPRIAHPQPALNQRRRS